jgi:L-seryl-tRNA(Ser) seleniumtransferase
VDVEGRLVIEVSPGASQVGGGSLPAQNLPTYVVAVRSDTLSARKMEIDLRHNKPPVIARIESDLYLLDARTLQAHELVLIQQAFQRVLAQTGGGEG